MALRAPWAVGRIPGWHSAPILAWQTSGLQWGARSRLYGRRGAHGPHYLEGGLGNDAVEITNRGGDIHRNGPLLLRLGFRGLFGRHHCGSFLGRDRELQVTARESISTAL